MFLELCSHSSVLQELCVSGNMCSWNSVLIALVFQEHCVSENMCSWNLVLKLCIPRALCFRKYVFLELCSRSSVFLELYVPGVLYSLRSMSRSSVFPELCIPGRSSVLFVCVSWTVLCFRSSAMFPELCVPCSRSCARCGALR